MPPRRVPRVRAGVARRQPGRVPRRAKIEALDRILHQQRTGNRERAPLDALPDGAFIALDGDPRPHLVLGGALHAWTPDGYAPARPRPSAIVEVLTPRSTLSAMRAGYRPELHPSATG
jgi:hypothetical protein